MAVVKTKYNIGDEEGTIAIVGPKRMEYSRVVNLLDYIKKQIESICICPTSNNISALIPRKGAEYIIFFCEGVKSYLFRKSRFNKNDIISNIFDNIPLFIQNKGDLLRYFSR